MTVKNRTCGECTLCCTVLFVPELKKPLGVTCSNCNNSGCSIYKDRPQSCRDFECQWLKGDMPDDMRPDKSHIIVEKLSGIPIVLALIEPNYGKDALQKATKDLLEYNKTGISVVASNRNMLIANGETKESIMKQVINTAKSMGVNN